MWELIKHWLDTRKRCLSCEANKILNSSLVRLIEEKDRQLAMVLSSHYDRPVIAQEEAVQVPNKDFIHAMNDVTEVSDAEFLEKI